MRFFGLSTCDTCRKARKQLEAAGHTFEVIDVRADGVADADLSAMLEAFGDKALNTRSTTWRGLSEAERARPPLDLLRAHPTLLKRPVIQDGDSWYQGWTKDVQATLLGEG